MVEARYYEKLKDGYVRCVLCPHNCVIGGGDSGKCRARKNVEGKLYTINKDYITSIAYDPIEKKPFYNFKRGSNILSIGNFGCNFKCEFCQNWQLVHKEDTRREYSEEDIVRQAGENGSIGLAYTYNEPTVWYESMLSLAKKIRDKGLVNTIITNGFINEDPLLELLPYIDAMNIDLKAFNNDFYRDICDGDIEPVKRTIEIASKHTHVEVSTLLIDGRNTDDEEIDALAKFLSEIDPDISLHLNRYYPAYRMEDPPTDRETIMKAKRIAERYLNHVYTGNIPN